MNHLLLIFYRIFVVPLVIGLVMPLLYLFNEKFRRGMALRFQRREWPQFKEPPIWIHAASGEFEYAKPLLRELKAKHPSCPLLVTYFSPTFAANIEKSPEVDCAWPLPLDLPGPLRIFLRRLKPRVAVIARTDLWPELLHQCQSQGVPTILFSARQSPVPAWNFLKRLLLRWNYGRLSQIFCVTEEDAAEIRKLAGKTPVQVAGDTRYDQVRYRLEHAKPLNENLKPDGSRPVLVAGSTWTQDEEKLLEGLTPLLIAKKLQLVLVPHEPTPDHIAALKNRLEKSKLTFDLYSTASRWATDVLIVDKVGLLAELYQWGNIAFVGGSFKSTVHSVMEPLAAGIPTLVGPYYRNNREAIEFQRLNYGPLSMVRSCNNAKELLARTLEILEARNKWLELRQEISRQISQRMGATRRISESIPSLGVPPHHSH